MARVVFPAARPSMNEFPGEARKVRYACPKCHAPIDVTEIVGDLKCKKCGFEVRLVGGVPSFTTSRVNEWQGFFEENAAGPQGDTIAAVECSTTLQHRYIVAAFRRIIGEIPEAASVLDAGCGNGLLWRDLMGPRPAIGVDFSIGMCALAQAKGMTACHADIAALPFADEQFDLIYCVGIVHYIVDLHALLAEFARVCRKAGRIVVSTVDRVSIVRRSLRAWRRLSPREEMPLSYRYIFRTASEVAAAATGLPLVLGAVEWTHFPLPWTHCSNSADYPLEPLASDAIVEFVKAPPNG